VKKYAIKEIFPTIQGEGYNAVYAAMFVRFAGCNLWSGRDEDRQRDAERGSVQCPRWCDTDFVGGDRMSPDDIAAKISWGWCEQPLIVFTGGEPLLQVDERLLNYLRAAFGPGPLFCFETNGTTLPAFKRTPSEWITLSPKVTRARCVLQIADEIKVLIPAYDHREWTDFPATHRYVQPVDGIAGSNRAAIAIAMGDPTWRLSVQAHKTAGFQ